MVAGEAGRVARPCRTRPRAQNRLPAWPRQGDTASGRTGQRCRKIYRISARESGEVF